MLTSSNIKFASDISKPCTPLYMQVVGPCWKTSKSLKATTWKSLNPRILNLKWWNHYCSGPSALEYTFSSHKYLNCRILKAPTISWIQNPICKKLKPWIVELLTLSCFDQMLWPLNYGTLTLTPCNFKPLIMEPCILVCDFNEH
jgi:hypothetical protein